jgi:DNA-binding NarL/FixJ family response regulator
MLTPRESDVVEVLLKGASNKEIARHLGISPFTVREHLRSAAQKLGCRNRVEIALRWSQQRSAAENLTPS